MSGSTISRDGPVAEPYWAWTADRVAAGLGCSTDGLSSLQAAQRLREYGPNVLRATTRLSRLRVLLAQIRSPLLLVLLFAAGASALTGEWIDAAIVTTIIVATVGISYSREYGAQTAVAALQARVRTRADVRRDGQWQTAPVEDVVPGDVVRLSAGSLVPGDGILLDATDCFVGEAALTGESYPVQKRVGLVSSDAPMAARRNCVFLGSSVRSGTATVLIVRTGTATEFGAIAERLTHEPPPTEFDRGLRRFGYLLTTSMIVLVFLVFLIHVVNGRAPVETLLFAVALAVGLSPELLPAILSVNLARSATQMAGRGVLVRRLNAIENLGSLDVLCTDKTGTLTEGVVQLEGAYDYQGAASPDVLTLGAWNAALETGLQTPLDEAIVRATSAARPSEVRKLAEIPFDFVRKRVSVIVETPEGARLITKGAYRSVVDACTRFADGRSMSPEDRTSLLSRYERWSADGIRVLAVASRRVVAREAYRREDERDLSFEGFLTFLDRPKVGVDAAIRDLAALGVSVKVITGDNVLVARHVAALVGLRADRVLSGRDLTQLSEEALWHAAEGATIFAEVDPAQKERIIVALKRTGHVVGFLGDGINDVPAMHAADTSLSVDQAVDVAREAADFVLLERDLDVIRRGIEAGRATFANTLKYVLTTMSANLGNMISMAVASLMLPFLPLLPGQILLNNFLSDVPAVGLADDRVDPEMVARPERWNMAFIARFMIEFGLLSSLFDFATFGVLLLVMRAGPELFRTAWFVESLLTELVIALVVRTRRPLFRSRPGRVLTWTTAVVVAVTFVIPYLPWASLLGFVPLPQSVLVTVVVITLAYIGAAEIAKRWFFQTEMSDSRSDSQSAGSA